MQASDPSDANCAKCNEYRPLRTLLQCGHSPFCTDCTAGKQPACSVCGKTCRKRNRCTNFTLNCAIRIMRPLDDIAQNKETLRDMVSCQECHKLPMQPVIFKCGHSTHCWKCWHLKLPTRCGRCDVLVRASDVDVNQSLGSLLLANVPEDYVGREAVDINTFDDTERRETVRIKSRQYDMPDSYIDKVFELFDRNAAQNGMGRTQVIRECKCGMVCVPKASKSGRMFFGCPLWRPGSQLRGEVVEAGRYHCNTFMWLSAKQAAVLGIV